MKKTALFLFGLLGVVCLAQMPPWGGFAPTNKSATAASSFNPSNGVANTIAFWSYRDLPLATVNSWTDEVSGIVMSNWNTTYAAPTNTGLGMFFNNDGLTNKTSLTNGPTFSLWAVVANTYYRSSYGQLLGQIPEQTGFYMNATATGYSPNGWWDGTAHINGYNMGTVLSTAYSASGVLTNAPIWINLIDNQGALIINGITQSGSLSQPGANISWAAIGNDSGGNAFDGYLKYSINLDEPCLYRKGDHQPLHLVDDQRRDERERRVCGLVEDKRRLQQRHDCRCDGQWVDGNAHKCQRHSLSSMDKWHQPSRFASPVVRWNGHLCGHSHNRRLSLRAVCFHVGMGQVHNEHQFILHRRGVERL